LSDFVTLNSEAEWDKWASQNYPNTKLYVVPVKYPVYVDHIGNDFLMYQLHYDDENTLDENVLIGHMCGCKVHQENKRIKNILDKNNATDQVRELVSDLEETIMDLQTDNKYYESILESKWPEGHEILEEAIRKYPRISSIPGPDFCVDKNKDI